jgi:hypothetical protein
VQDHRHHPWRKPSLVVAALATVLRGQPGRNAGDNDDTTRHLSERWRVGIWLGLPVVSKPDDDTGTRSGVQFVAPESI